MLAKFRNLFENKKETILAAIAFLLLPVFMYKKVFAPKFGIKFSYWQTLKNIFKYCFIWSSLYLLPFILLALTIFLSESNNNKAYALVWVVYFGLMVFFSFLSVAILIIGIETIILSIKNFRFLIIGAVLILSYIFIFFPLSSIFVLPIG